MAFASVNKVFKPIASQLEHVENDIQKILTSNRNEVIQILARHVAKGKGKRFRPALVLLSAQPFVSDHHQLTRFASVYELIHTATLVHDDVIDHAQLRRGAPTMNRVWGNTLTVLFGDLLYLDAMTHAIKGRRWDMMDTLASTTTLIIEGELIQNHNLFKMDAHIENYYQMIERKTAVLFSACCQVGPMIADQSQEIIHDFKEYGLLLGRAFQIVDDLLDFTSDEAALGKPVFSDLREGKLTLPMLYLLKEKESPRVKEIVRNIWDRGEEIPIPKDEEVELRSMLDFYGCLSKVHDEAAVLSNKASHIFDKKIYNHHTYQLFRELCSLMLERKK